MIVNELTIIGVGPGEETFLTQQAEIALREATVVFGARRHAHLAKREIFPLEPLAEGVETIKKALEQSDVAVMVSGDPTFFSLAKTLQKRLDSAIPMRYIAGISSVQALFCALNEDASDAVIYSLHGRTMGEERIIRHIQHTKTVVYLMDSIFNPSQICSLLVKWNMGDVDVAIGENISYKYSRLMKGEANDFCDQTWQSNCVMRIRNQRAIPLLIAPTIRDDAWVRAGVPMSKEEVRMVSICKLAMSRHSLLWDIGAGTGSIAIQSAQLLSEGMVYAIDHNPEAIALIQENARKHSTPNVIPVEGSCPEALQTLPTPTHVFIGGSGGHLCDILKEICRRGSGIHIVMNAVTLRTLQEADRLLRSDAWTDYRSIQMQVNTLNTHTSMFAANNPVYIMSACTTSRVE